MVSSWDIYVFFPIIIVALVTIFLTLYFRYFKKNFVIEDKKVYFFILQTACFWIALSLLISHDYPQNPHLQIGNLKINSYFKVLFSSIAFYVFILTIPINLLSKKIKNRRIISLSSTILVIIGAAFSFFGKSESSAVIILGIATFGLGTTLFTLQLLAHNEYPNKRYLSIKTVNLILPITLISILIGVWINYLFKYNLDNHFDIDNKACCAISLIILLISLFLGFFFPNHSRFIQPFSDDVIPSILSKFNWKQFLPLLIVSIIIFAIESLINSPLMYWLIGQRCYDAYQNSLIVDQNLRINRFLFFTGICISSLLFGWYFIRKIGINYTFNIGLLLFIIYLIFASFTHSAWVLCFMSILNGMAFGIILTIIIALLLMWNYREKSLLIFPFTFMICVGVYFAISYIIAILEMNQFGVFAYKDTNFNFVTDNPLAAFYINDVTTVIYTICNSFIMLIYLYMYFYADPFFAEYIDIKKYTSDTLYKLQKFNITQSTTIQKNKTKR